jgi:hypothetical protein
MKEGGFMRVQRLLIVGLVLLVCFCAYGCSSTPPSDRESTNLLQNGSFENTGSDWLAPWVFETRGTAVIQHVSNTQARGVYGVSITIRQASAADNAVQLHQDNIPLTQGESYTLVFWAKASTPQPIRPDILHGAYPWISYFSQVLTLATAWHQYTLTFTAPQTDTNGQLLFNMGNATGQIWIDNVSLQPTGEPKLTPFTNLLQNGSFEQTGSNWLAPWVFETTNATATIQHVSDTQVRGVYGILITIRRASAADNAVQLHQNNISLVGGELYTLVFWAKASTPQPIRPDVLHGTHPWTSYFSQVVTLTTAWRQYTLAFVPPQTDTNGRLLFNMGNAAGQIWIDNISLQQSM